ncbi:MAG: glycosyltransferase family 39 protein [bacterium]|nr:glycosyltransferase family 39 protein [bacterium]
MSLKKLSNHLKPHWIAILVLISMLGLSVYAMSQESAIVDESPHLAAGYGQAVYGDYRLNPEHPPLIKQLAGWALWLYGVNFPESSVAWSWGTNEQWVVGPLFLYESGNNPEAMLFWARLPVVLLAVLGGLILYIFCKRRFGKPAALLALIFYVFCPTVLAHSHYVTTDMGITVMTIFTLIAFIRFFEVPNLRRGIVASIILTLMLLTKFSGVLLLPVIVGLALMFTWAHAQSIRSYLISARNLFLIFAASFITIWIAYIPVTIGMPLGQQDALIGNALGYLEELPPGSRWLLEHNDITGLAPIAHYILGFVMVYGRLNDGNTVYLFGEVTNESFSTYFPLVFLVKTPPALLVAIAVSVIAFVARMKWRIKNPYTRFREYIHTHFVETSFFLTAAAFWYISVRGNLNLGLRHILPAVVLMSTLTAIYIGRRVQLSEGKSKSWWRFAAIALSGWYILSVMVQAPNFTSYISEFFGGPSKGYLYISDSSLDWGQDLKKLDNYLEKHPEITPIAVDYFGGSSVEYYACDGQMDCKQDRIVEWHADWGRYPGQYIAVSETFLMNDLYYAAKRNDPAQSYQYLRDREPIERVGNSIYVYKLY